MIGQPLKEGQADCRGEADIKRIDTRMSFNVLFNDTVDQGQTPRMQFRQGHGREEAARALR